MKIECLKKIIVNIFFINTINFIPDNNDKRFSSLLLLILIVVGV
jgi:hypothetical protein